MGERKGQNKYYPPDYDPKVGGLNKFLGTHALRERAKKIHLGIIIIRFEMPYNIWCDGCKNHIGMGVRYNAEKTKVGMYYSTAVYQFRMKCHLCDNYIEIKTDPGNLDYEIVSGARRQENRWDPTENGQIVADTKEVQRKLFDDPMFKLEHVAGDAKKSDDAKPIIGSLYKRNDDVWRDNYEANCKLRSTFRKRKKELKILQDEDNDLLSRSSLSINLLPETEQDKHMASLMRLQAAKTIAEREKDKIADIMNRPALPSATITSFGGLKREKQLNVKLLKKDLGIVKKTERSETLLDLTNTVPDVESSPNNNNPIGLNESMDRTVEGTSDNDSSGIPSNKSSKRVFNSLVSDDYFNSSSGSDNEVDSPNTIRK